MRSKERGSLAEAVGRPWTLREDQQRGAPRRAFAETRRRPLARDRDHERRVRRRQHAHRGRSIQRRLRRARAPRDRPDRRRAALASLDALDRHRLPPSDEVPSHAGPVRRGQERRDPARDAAGRQSLAVRHAPPLVVALRKKIDSALGTAKPVPVYIPVANEVARRMAMKMGGFAQSGLVEVLFNKPTTAHILGGCPIGLGAGDGGRRHAVPRVRLRGSVRRRRLRHPGEPRRESEPDHHRDGRARDEPRAREGIAIVELELL